MMEAKDLMRRFKKAKERKMTTWYSHMRECYEYAVPQRETFFEYTPGQKKNTKVFDGTAIIGTPIYANRIQQAIMPSGTQWAKLVAGSLVDEEQRITFFDEDLTIEEALERVTDIAFDYINRSNLYTKAHEALIDMAVSTGSMTCDYDPENDELLFDAVPLSHVYLEAGPRGSVDGFWRCHEMPIANVLRLWPDAIIPENLEQTLREKPETEIEVIEGMIYLPKEKKFYLYVLHDKKMMYEEDYGESSPFMSFRTTVVPGEVYGRGPLMRVLPDIKTLNLMSENALKSAQLAVGGVWTGVDDGIMNPYNIRLAPGVVIPVGSNTNDNPTLRRLDMGGDVQMHEFEYNRRVDNVNRALFAKPIGDIQDPTKTATEISLRMQLDLQDAGAEFGRLINEFAGAVFRRVVYLLSKEGIIPELKLDGKNVDIKFTSPFSRQADEDEVTTLMKTMGYVGSMGLPPEIVMADLKVEDMPRFILDKLGGPSELKRDIREKTKMGEAAGQMMAQQMQPAAPNV